MRRGSTPRPAQPLDRFSSFIKVCVNICFPEPAVRPARLVGMAWTAYPTPMALLPETCIISFRPAAQGVICVTFFTATVSPNIVAPAVVAQW